MLEPWIQDTGEQAVLIVCVRIILFQGFEQSSLQILPNVCLDPDTREKQ
jgi:hypothetical protein